MLYLVQLSLIFMACRVTGTLALAFGKSLPRGGTISLQSRSFARVNPFSALYGGFGFPSKLEKDPGAVPGTNLRVLKYPNPKLRQENEIVNHFDDELRNLAKQMMSVMYAAEGVGLAAPQVGINKRLMVFNEEGDPQYPEKEMVLVNPTIIAKSPERATREEGCLSFPDIGGHVSRAVWIEVEYQDMEGVRKTVVLEGISAVIFQHEYDHLDKILFIDHLSAADRERNARKLEKLIKKFGPGGAL